MEPKPVAELTDSELRRELAFHPGIRTGDDAKRFLALQNEQSRRDILGISVEGDGSGEALPPFDGQAEREAPPVHKVEAYVEGLQERYRVVDLEGNVLAENIATEAAANHYAGLDPAGGVLRTIQGESPLKRAWDVLDRAMQAPSPTQIIGDLQSVVVKLEQGQQFTAEDERKVAAAIVFYSTARRVAGKNTIFELVERIEKVLGKPGDYVAKIATTEPELLRLAKHLFHVAKTLQYGDAYQLDPDDCRAVMDAADVLRDRLTAVSEGQRIANYLGEQEISEVGVIAAECDSLSEVTIQVLEARKQRAETAENALAKLQGRITEFGELLRRHRDNNEQGEFYGDTEQAHASELLDQIADLLPPEPETQEPADG